MIKSVFLKFQNNKVFFQNVQVRRKLVGNILMSGTEPIFSAILILNLILKFEVESNF